MDLEFCWFCSNI